ncbi:MAG: hypothetical protein CMM24_03465 [Rhodospirillaceae bacterium]|nr:hypothetical protein [Rhodospirillaceae bacterium]MBU99400.1 hypothetical protein [Rhodospirillaceae bacterium]|tara:strand:- start:412 stop:1086 length:675 start_codon:yes stop_codon:yes gene_type:complete
MHPSGALYWPSQLSLLVADLHFEKGSSYHKTGQFLPPYDTHQTLEKLETVIKYFKPRRIFFLGDTFHDMSAWKRMPDVNKSRLLDVVEDLEVVWIEGNHDQGGLPDRFKSVKNIEVDGITLRHIMQRSFIGPEISAHFHPAGVIKFRGMRIRRPCFIKSGQKFVVPSFGVLTGGLDFSDDAFEDFHNCKTHLFFLGERKIFRSSAGYSKNIKSSRGDRNNRQRG